MKDNNIIAFFVGTDKEEQNFLHLKLTETTAIMEIFETEDYYEFKCSQPGENNNKKARLES